MAGSVGVEEGGDAGDGDGQEGSLPSGWDVGVIPEDDETLNHGTSEVRSAGSASLPTQRAGPAYNVAEVPLGVLWGELRNPVVLTSRGRS